MWVKLVIMLGVEGLRQWKMMMQKDDRKFKHYLPMEVKIVLMGRKNTKQAEKKTSFSAHGSKNRAYG